MSTRRVGLVRLYAGGHENTRFFCDLIDHGFEPVANDLTGHVPSDDGFRLFLVGDEVEKMPQGRWVSPDVI